MSKSIGIDLEGVDIPENFRLSQNYPNPFNNRTQIEFQTPKSSNVKIQVINILGQKVRTLAHRRYDAGSYKVNWNGKNDNGLEVNSGIYFVRMESEGFKKTIEVLLIK
jgi:flagellar hook assembly protein FlgD